MNHTHRTRLASVLSIAALILPAAASALSVSELQSQIQTLLQQLQTLQQQLHDARGQATTTPIVASTTPSGHPCIELARTLSQGMQGEDVRELQRRLLESGDLTDTTAVTGLFGPKTLAAVHRMQQRFGIASSTGIVGPTTRERLKADCARKLLKEFSDDLHGASTTPGAPGMPGDRERGLGDIWHATMTPPIFRSDDRGSSGWLSSTTPPMFRPKENADADRGGIGSGTIASIGATSITVTTGNGATKIVNVVDTTVIKFFSASTTQMLTGTLSSLSVGDHVIVHGSSQADGAINAVLIQRMPMLPPMQRPALPGNSGTTTAGRPIMPGMMFGGDGLGR